MSDYVKAGDHIKAFWVDHTEAPKGWHDREDVEAGSPEYDGEENWSYGEVLVCDKDKIVLAACGGILDGAQVGRIATILTGTLTRIEWVTTHTVRKVDPED